MDQQYMCISCSRRFEKSMAIEMLSAYYVYQNDSHSQFDSLKIAKQCDCERHLNHCNVICRNFWTIAVV